VAALDRRRSRGDVRRGTRALPRSDTRPSSPTPGGDWTRIAVGEPVEGLAAVYHDSAKLARDVRAESRRGPTNAAPLLHEWARRPGPSWSSTPTRPTRVRAPLHGVTGSAPGRRRAPQRVLARLGEARVEQRFRRRGSRRHRVRRHQPRFDAAGLLDAMARSGVTTFCRRRPCAECSCRRTCGRTRCRRCARSWAPVSRSTRGVEQVQHAWGMTVRDGFGRPRPPRDREPARRPAQARLDGPALPAHGRIARPVNSEPGDEGEICLDLSARPTR